MRLTIFICVFTSLVPIPLFFFFDNGSGLCAINASDNLAYTTFALIAIGILPPGSMIIFTILARYNLTQIRGRVQVHDEQPAQQMHIRKRDYDLLKMLVGEVILFCATTSVYPASTLYNYLTGPLREYKSAMRLAVESLIGYIIHPLLSFTYCCTQFYGRVSVTVDDALTSEFVFQCTCTSPRNSEPISWRYSVDQSESQMRSPWNQRTEEQSSDRVDMIL